jgi:hypothetical protein
MRSPPERERPPRAKAAGRETKKLPTQRIPKRRSCVNCRYPRVIVDAYALDPDNDFPVACRESWYGGAS